MRLIATQRQAIAESRRRRFLLELQLLLPAPGATTRPAAADVR